MEFLSTGIDDVFIPAEVVHLLQKKHRSINNFVNTGGFPSDKSKVAFVAPSKCAESTIHDADVSFETTEEKNDPLNPIHDDNDDNDDNDDHNIRVPTNFLRDVKGDINLARERYKATLKWRKEENVDNIIHEPFIYFHLIKKCHPHYFHLRGKNNEPVYYESPPKMDMKRLKAAGMTMDDILRYYILVTEYTWSVIEPSDEAQSIYVIDLDGARIKDLVGDVKDFVRKLAAFTSAHYPERSSTIFIINAPSWFQLIWELVVTLVGKDITERIVILRGKQNILNGLLKHIDLENIPRDYGGLSLPLGQSPEEKEFAKKMQDNVAEHDLTVAQFEESSNILDELGNEKMPRTITIIEEISSEKSTYTVPTLENSVTEEEEERIEYPICFYHAAGHDVIEGRKRYQNTLLWRKQARMDSIVNESFVHYHHLKKHYPHFFHLRGRNKEPIFYESPPSRKDTKLLEAAGIQIKDIVRYFAMLIEYTWTVIEPSDEYVQSIHVIDLKHMRKKDLMSQHGMDSIVRTLLIYSKHYPGRLGTVFVINVPRKSKQIIWDKITSLRFVDEGSKQRVCILRKKKQIEKGLLQYIDRVNIPCKYGGGDGSRRSVLGESPEEKVFDEKMKQNLNQVNDTTLPEL